MLASGLGLAIVGALIAGFLPAFRASRLDAMQVIKSAGPKSSAGRGERRLLRAVTIGQTALTLALLVGAGLLLRTTSNLSRVQSGYNIDQILTMTVTAVQGDWNNFHTLALERVSSLLGGRGRGLRMGRSAHWQQLAWSCRDRRAPPIARPSDAVALPCARSHPGYFDLLRIPISEGRDFRSTDANKAPRVAIVNRAPADRYLPGTSALGKKLWQGSRQQPPMEIVGVVANSRSDDLTRTPEPELYLSLWQAGAFSKDLVIRTTADPRLLMTAIQKELRSVDPTVAIENVERLNRSVTIRWPRVDSRCNSSSGSRSSPACSHWWGLYGVLSLSVASRRREIAVRSAVGAQERDIRNLVFAEAFRLIAGVSWQASSRLLCSRAV